jgi:hypothetical protein
MSIGDCPNWPGCGHRAQGQCDANMVGERPGVPIWTPLSGESIPNCLANSLKRAGELLRSTGNTGDSIDASRIEYLRLQILSGAYGVAPSAPDRTIYSGSLMDELAHRDAAGVRRDVLNRCEPCVWRGKLCDGTCGVKVIPELDMTGKPFADSDGVEASDEGQNNE